MSCEAGGGLCEQPTHKAGLCRGHYERRRRGQPIGEPLRWYADPKRSLFEAALALAEVGDDDAAYLRIIRRFWMAHRRLADAARNNVYRRAQSGEHGRKQP